MKPMAALIISLLSETIKLNFPHKNVSVTEVSLCAMIFGSMYPWKFCLNLCVFGRLRPTVRRRRSLILRGLCNL